MFKHNYPLKKFWANDFYLVIIAVNKIYIYMLIVKSELLLIYKCEKYEK